MFSFAIWVAVVSGLGLLKLHSLISRWGLFYSVCLLGSSNHFHIWRVSPQLSCGDTYQIWTWYSISNKCFDNGENCEINGTGEICLITPPWTTTTEPIFHVPLFYRFCRYLWNTGYRLNITFTFDGTAVTRWRSSNVRVIQRNEQISFQNQKFP